MPTPEKKPVVNPKTVAWSALVAAIFGVAVLYYPPLLPVCQALSFCDEPAADAAPVTQ